MNDLVIVHPMTSYSGSVAYLEYVALDAKGGVNQGDVFNGVFGLGEMTDGRVNYTSQIIVESGSTASLEVVENGLTYEDNGAIKNATYKLIGTDAEGNAAYEYADSTTGSVVTTISKIAYVAKQWQMNEVPAQDIPTIGPRMKHIALVAEPRRIAVRYDQITAFKAKTDYGFSLDKQIA